MFVLNPFALQHQLSIPELVHFKGALFYALCTLHREDLLVLHLLEGQSQIRTIRFAQCQPQCQAKRTKCKT